MKRKAHFQGTLASQSSYEKFGRKSKRELFLDEMNAVVPWGALLSLVEPYYPKVGNCRRPVGLGHRTSPMPLGLEDSSSGYPLHRARHRIRTKAPHRSCQIPRETTSSIWLQRPDHSCKRSSSIKLADPTLEEVIFDGVADDPTGTRDLTFGLPG